MDLKDGKLTHDALVIDTTRVRVFGEGGADFAHPGDRVSLPPACKAPVLFSLQPPIEVTGTMTNFRIRGADQQQLRTVARFLTSVFVVPFQVLTQGPPAGGRRGRAALIRSR